MNAATTDYERELARLTQAAAELAGAGRSAALDAGESTRLAWLTYQRAMLTGQAADRAAARADVESGLTRHPAWPDLWLIRAMLAAYDHAWADVRAYLAAEPGLATSPLGRGLTIDADAHEHRYDEAVAACRQLVAEHRGWEMLARLAHLTAEGGDLDGALALYEEAADGLIAKEMRAYAWLQLQMGALEVRRGRPDTAWRHYRRAEASFTGYWVTAHHIAELTEHPSDQ